MLVERHALRLVVFELSGVTTVGSAEVVQIGRSVVRRLDRLAQRLSCLACLLQPLSTLLKPVLQQTLHIGLVVPVECLARVVLNGLLQRPEQILVVDDVAVFLVFAVEAIDSADRLE